MSDTKTIDHLWPTTSVWWCLFFLYSIWLFRFCSGHLQILQLLSLLTPAHSAPPPSRPHSWTLGLPTATDNVPTAHYTVKTFISAWPVNILSRWSRGPKESTQPLGSFILARVSADVAWARRTHRGLYGQRAVCCIILQKARGNKMNWTIRCDDVTGKKPQTDLHNAEEELDSSVDSSLIFTVLSCSSTIPALHS